MCELFCKTRLIKRNISLPAESHHSTSRPAERAGCSQRGDRRERREGRGGPGKEARLEAQGVVLSCAAAAKKKKTRASLVRGEVRVASDMPEWPWEKKHRERARGRERERARESEGEEPDDVRLLASFQRSLLNRTIVMSVSKDCRQFPFHPLFFLLFLPRRWSTSSCCCHN